MHGTAVSIVTLGALLLGAAASAQAPVSQVEAHIAAARAAAGQEYRATFVNLGSGRAGRGVRTGPRRSERGRDRRRRPIGRGGYASLHQVCSDNLYWLQALASIRLGVADQRRPDHRFDTNFAWATQPEILDGLTALKLDPRDISASCYRPRARRYDQGAAWNCSAAMAPEIRHGRRGLVRLRCSASATAAGGVPTPRGAGDVSVGREGTKITLGDTTVTVVATPGHTAGTASAVFPRSIRQTAIRN